METNALLEAEVKRKGLDVLKSHGGHAGNYTYVLTIRGCVGMLSDGTERRTSRSFSGRGVTSTEAGRAAVMNALAGVKKYVSGFIPASSQLFACGTDSRF